MKKASNKISDEKEYNCVLYNDCLNVSLKALSCSATFVLVAEGKPEPDETGWCSRCIWAASYPVL